MGEMDMEHVETRMVKLEDRYVGVPMFAPKERQRATEAARIERLNNLEPRINVIDAMLGCYGEGNHGTEPIKGF